MPQTNADIARMGFSAVVRGDIDAIADLFAPEVKWHGGDPTSEGACVNRHQVLTWIRNGSQRRSGPWPDLVDVVDGGERVVVIMQPPATRDDPSPCQVANLTTFQDGKVVEMVHYADAADALRVLAERRDSAG